MEVKELKEIDLNESSEETVAERKKKDRLINVKKDKSLYQKCEKDREKVRGIFRFFAIPGGILSFSYRKYKWDTVENYELIDGGVYELPIGVAKHLNNGCWYPEYDYIPGMNMQTAKPVSGSGFRGGRHSQLMRVGKKIHRTAFQPLDFTDVPELALQQKEIAVVNYVS